MSEEKIKQAESLSHKNFRFFEGKIEGYYKRFVIFEKNQLKDFYISLLNHFSNGREAILEKLGFDYGLKSFDDLNKEIMDEKSCLQYVLTELNKLDKNAAVYFGRDLGKYSPKMARMLEIINRSPGLVFVYSAFRTLEGIEIFSRVLKANGYEPYNPTLTPSGNRNRSVSNKLRYAIWSGTESEEERTNILNLYNSYENRYGEKLKVLLATSAGAEGIDLKNVRYVHIVEPYWHPVRIEQVIGRARRICSHASLPVELRTVEVLLYLMEFTQEQLSTDKSLELRLKDKSKMDNTTPFTSDQTIYEIASIKEDVNSQLLTAVKEASIDCVIHSKSGSKEGLKCFTFGGVTNDKFATTPSISAEESDAIAEANLVKVTWKAKTVTVEGIKYALREDTGELYDLESFKAKNPVLVGNLEKQGRRYKVTWI